MKANIKAVILDCFGVLYVPAVEDFFRSNADNFEDHKQEIKDLGKQADYGLISQNDYAKSAAELLGLDTGLVKENVLSGMVRNKPLLDYVESIRDRYKIGLLSNISMHTMDRFFSEEEREQLFDEVVLSSEVGMIKPNPEIFELIAERLGVDTSEAIMVDDSKENCMGAISAGMKAVNYEDFDKAKNEIEKLLGS